MVCFCSCENLLIFPDSGWTNVFIQTMSTTSNQHYLRQCKFQHMLTTIILILIKISLSDMIILLCCLHRKIINVKKKSKKKKRKRERKPKFTIKECYVEFNCINEKLTKQVINQNKWEMSSIKAIELVYFAVRPIWKICCLLQYL